MRVAIVGNSGSGKTTLATRLARSCSADILDLHTVAWEPGQIAVARDPLAASGDVRAFCAARDRWIVEGCYGRLIEVSLSFRPQLLFLDPGEERCLANCRGRPWEPHKYASREEQDERLQYLLSWVREYYTRAGDLSHAGHLALFAAYTGPKQRLRELSDEPFALADEASGQVS